MFLVRFWGVRGSIPAPGPNTAQIGGNTTCIEVRAGSEIIIFDAGTGIRALGNQLLKEQPVTARMFFTHVHWDHIQGFPFFMPAFVKGNRFDLHGACRTSASLAEILAGQMNYPNFPVSLEEMGSEMNFHDLRENSTTTFGDVQVRNTLLNHPGGVFGYRVDHGGRSMVLATDTEHYSVLDSKLLSLAEGADLLIYDAMHTPEEYRGTDEIPARTGWGHSTWEEAIKQAKAAKVGKLVLFHHDPDHDDDAVREIEARARALLPGTVVAYEGLEIELD
jgi:phosphoribosyl 1,2-cyclic phosphodiesterase